MKTLCTELIDFKFMLMCDVEGITEPSIIYYGAEWNELQYIKIPCSATAASSER
jgi:hypothetical protein